MIVMEDVDMRKYTTFKAGGRARKMLVCESERDVADAIEEIKEKKRKIYSDRERLQYFGQECQL